MLSLNAIFRKLPRDAANVQYKLWADSYWDISLWISVTFSAFCLHSYHFKVTFSLSHLPFACPLFLSTREGWDDYHSREIKGQRGFSSGRLISWPWHSLCFLCKIDVICWLSKSLNEEVFYGDFDWRKCCAKGKATDQPGIFCSQYRHHIFLITRFVAVWLHAWNEEMCCKVGEKKV